MMTNLKGQFVSLKMVKNMFQIDCNDDHNDNDDDDNDNNDDLTILEGQVVCIKLTTLPRIKRAEGHLLCQNYPHIYHHNHYCWLGL